MAERCPRQVFVDEGFPYGCCALDPGHAGHCELLTEERERAEAASVRLTDAQLDEVLDEALVSLDRHAKGRIEVARGEAKRKASLRRLKQRIANVTSDIVGDRDGFMRSGTRRAINAAIDAWDAAERKRGAR